MERFRKSCSAVDFFEKSGAAMDDSCGGSGIYPMIDTAELRTENDRE